MPDGYVAGVAFPEAPHEVATVARLQSAPIGGSDENATPALPALPPLPEAALPAAVTDPDLPPSTPVAGAGIAGPAPVVATPAAAGVPAVNPGGSFGFRSLSSIARNRLANRVLVAPLENAGGMLSDAAAGRLTPGPYGQRPGVMSSILRNRLQGEGEQQYNYPDVHSDPAKNYHDRYGIDEDHDPFVFPWLINLIFEDRWLLGETDPTRAVQDQFRRRMKIDIRDPDPDTANFPNGAYTLPKGRLYLETSPVGFYGGSKYVPRTYQWEYLLRYGLTDNLEFRIFSNGFTAQSGLGKQHGTTGYSPLAFDFKANFWEENTKYFIPAMGVEMYIQTTFGSPAFNSGTQPSMNLLFDQSLPFGFGFEYNVGISGAQTGQGQTVYEFSYQWSLQHEIVRDFDIFCHGFYNAASLPRLLNYQAASGNNSIPTINVVGVGAIWTVNNRLAIFGSYNFGTTPGSPKTIALTGFALAF